MQKLATVATFLAISIPCANAAEPENYIKYRQAIMEAMGGHTGAAAQIVRGKVSPEGALKLHADSLAALAQNLTTLFPEGSDFGETDALPKIWTEWPKFEQAAANAKTATETFATAVASGDQAKIGEAFKGVGDACKGCHKDFRENDD